MSFTNLVAEMLKSHPDGLTPQEIRDKIKIDHSEYYGTEAHRRYVEKGHFSSLDHALQAKVYQVSRNPRFVVDRSTSPLLMSLSTASEDEEAEEEELIEGEDLDKLEAGSGTLYVLGTGLFTGDGKGVIKIGITTREVANRIKQLYTTNVPFRFTLLKEVETKNFYELEQSLHKLLDPFRLNKSREFFSDDCIPSVDAIIEIHESIQSQVTPLGAQGNSTLSYSHL